MPCNGINDIIVTVNIVYAGKTVTKQLTVPKKVTDFPPIISAPSQTCSSTFRCTVAGLRPNYTIQNWNYSSNLSLISQSGHSAVFQVINNGLSWVEATYNPSLCGTGFPLSRVNIVTGGGNYTLHVSRPDGIPINNGEYGDLQACPFTNYEFYIDANMLSCNTTDHYWQVPSTWTINSMQGNFLSVNTNSDPNNFIAVDATGCCGESVYLSQYFDYGTTCNQYYMNINPNPASNEVTIEISSYNKNLKVEDNIGWDLEIYTLTNLLKEKKSKINGKKVVINVSSWKEGIYYVKSNVKGEKISGKIIVKK